MKKFFFFLMFSLSSCASTQANYFDTDSFNIRCRAYEAKFCENRGGRVGNCRCVDGQAVEGAINNGRF